MRGRTGRGQLNPPGPIQGAQSGPWCGGVAGQPVRVATVASWLRSRPPGRLQSPPPHTALPRPSRSSLLLSFRPSLLPSVPPSLLSFSTALLRHLKGQSGCRRPNRRQRRSGTVSSAAASAWPHRERLDPATGARNGEWGRGATLSPGARVFEDPAPPEARLGTREGVLWGGGRHACWVAGAALRPQCQPGSANKAAFSRSIPWRLEHRKDTVVMEMGPNKEAGR